MSNPTSPMDARESEEGRAQPGDVLGVERDGERTHLGETREDEDERRENAGDAVRDEQPKHRANDRSAQ
jgi:hypothetical protein